jgi:hypothetical protein
VSDNVANSGGGGMTVDGGTLLLDAAARITRNSVGSGGGVAMGSNLSVLDIGGTPSAS